MDIHHWWQLAAGTTVTVSSTSALSFTATASSANNWLLVNGQTEVSGMLPATLTISPSSNLTAAQHRHLHRHRAIHGSGRIARLLQREPYREWRNGRRPDGFTQPDHAKRFPGRCPRTANHYSNERDGGSLYGGGDRLRPLTFKFQHNRGTRTRRLPSR